MIDNKEKLISLVCTVLRNFILSQIAIKRIEDDPVINTKVIFDTGKEKASLSIESLFIDEKTGKIIDNEEIFGNCKRNLPRAVIAESFELIKKYCQNINQLDIFKNSKNYHFFRIICNCSSHGTGGTLNEWPVDPKKKGIKKVEWRHKEINESMVGKSISMTDPGIILLI